MTAEYPVRILHQADVESVIQAKIVEAELNDLVVGTTAGTVAAGNDSRFTSGVWGPWTDGVSASAANLADVAHAINTTDKAVGKMVWDTTNHIPLFAGGAAAADHWYTVAGVDTISPV